MRRASASCLASSSESIKEGVRVDSELLLSSTVEKTLFVIILVGPSVFSLPELGSTRFATAGVFLHLVGSGDSAVA